MTYSLELSYRPETRVVLIGTTVCPKDEELLPALPQIATNIHHLRSLLTDSDAIDIPEESVIEIIDDEAGSIVDKIAEAADDATDTLIIYCAGHGILGTDTCPLYLQLKTQRMSVSTPTQ